MLSEDQWFKDESLALFYRDCLAFYLGVRVAVSEKDLQNGEFLYQQFLLRAKALDSRRNLAVKTSTYSSWLRATNLLEIGAAELKGMLTELEAKPLNLGAVNWYRGAIERQFRPANQLPPVMDYPVEYRLGNFYLSQGEFTKAGKAFREGLKVRPNHLPTLRGYYKALTGLGRSADAASLEKRIKMVAQPASN